jgi:kanamycin kinase
VERLRWARPFTSVPVVVAADSNADGSWMITEGLPGQNAVAPRWLARPAMAVAAIGRGLRGLHDALPVDSCPFSWSVTDRLAAMNVPPEHAAHLSAPPAIDRLVVCHGDPCAPNTLLNDDGQCSGHVDLGDLGVADRWADLAVAIWNIVSNFGPEWEQPLLNAYGIAPDPARTVYYRQLWDLHLQSSRANSETGTGLGLRSQ